MRSQAPKVLSLELALVLLLGLLWGSPYALTKIALVTIPPVTLVAGRVALAAAVLWLVVLVRRKQVPATWGFAGRVFIQGTITCVIPYTLIAIGQQTVDSGLAAILNSTIPFIVCVICVSWLHEPVTPRRIFGVALGFGGVVGIAGASALFGLGQNALGQAAIMVATMSSAASVIHGRRFESVAPEVVTAGMLTCAAIVLVPLSLVLETPWQLSPSIQGLVALLVNAVVATGLGFVLYFRLIRTVGSLSTASTSYLKPAVGVFIGSAFLGEPLTWALVGGLIAIFIGVAAINAPGPVPEMHQAWRRKGDLRNTSNPIV